MKVWVNKKNFEIFKDYQNEGRTLEIEISTFRRFEDNREIELELKE